MVAVAPDLRRDILQRSVLACVTSSEFDAILSRATLRRVDRGATILRRGHPGSGMFVVATGRVRVGLTSEDGKEVTLGMLGPGEMSLLDGEDCSADAYAHEESILLAIERGSFLRLLRADADCADPARARLRPAPSDRPAHRAQAVAAGAGCMVARRSFLIAFAV